MKRPLVLVVEDNDSDWEVYGKMLWYNGYDVLHAPDGEEGLRLAHDRHPDLVLLDLMLPKVSGIDVCRRLREADDTRKIPVVVLTARSASEVADAARAAGCDRFLQKPVGPVEVLHEVESVIGKAPAPGEARLGEPPHV